MTDPLKRVERAAQQLAQARTEYRDALVAAAEEYTYTAIGEAAGVSKQAVRSAVLNATDKERRQ